MATTDEHSAAEPSRVLSRSDAIAAMLVGAIASDGVLRDEESARLNEVLAGTRWVRGAGDEPVDSVKGRALDLIAHRGIGAVMSACAAAIPPDLRPTTLALCADLVLADGRLGSRETAFLDDLRMKLGLDDALARKIIEVMLIKNRAAGPPDE